MKVKAPIGERIAAFLVRIDALDMKTEVEIH
jgi:hypothetical protein